MTRTSAPPPVAEAPTTARPVAIEELAAFLAKHATKPDGVSPLWLRRSQGGPDLVVVRGGGPIAKDFDAHPHDLVASLSTGLTLDEIHECANRAGLWVPLPRGAMSLFDFCLAAPWFVDCFVRDLDAVTPRGLPFSTPRAPRAAVGPDFIGGLMTSMPLAFAVRVRLRVASRERAIVVRTLHGMSDAVATLVVEAMAEGRAFWVSATEREVVLVTAAAHTSTTLGAGSDKSTPGQSRSGSSGIGETHGLAAKLPPWQGASALDLSQPSEVRRHLDDGGWLLGSPTLGRGFGFDNQPLPDLAIRSLEDGITGMLARATFSPEQAALGSRRRQGASHA